MTQARKCGNKRSSMVCAGIAKRSVPLEGEVESGNEVAGEAIS